MPTINVNGADIYYENHGAGAPVVFAHGLLFSCRMFRRQVETLSQKYRCIAFDSRSHGNSERTAVGLDMETLADDAAALIESLNAAPCHFIGLSMGGFVGLRLAARRPELIRSLALLDTSADREPNIWKYRVLNAAARIFGLRRVAKRALPVIFSKPFLSDPERAAELSYWREQIIANDRDSITRAVSATVHRPSVVAELGRIAVPTLVLVGELDTVTPPACSHRLHNSIAGSRLVTIPAAGHITPIEAPEAVNAALGDFLADVENGRGLED